MPRVLLIGSSYGGLDVEPSVASMRTWLMNQVFQDGTHNFHADDIETLVGACATRDAILAGLRRLGDEDHGGAPVVVYFAGHGYLYRTDIGAPEAGAHLAYPLLVAVDIDTSAGGTLHSVFAPELSRELRRIARRARNFTVILDCCHASGMVRLDDEVEGEFAGDVEKALHVQAAARVGRKNRVVMRGDDTQRPPRFSEQVVVLAASSSGGRAYPDPATGRMVFTDALLAALAQHATWDAVLAATRARVHEVWPHQQPAVFGPRFRRPLTLAEQLPEHDLYHVEPAGEQVALLAGSMRAVHRDDEFELLPVASTTCDRKSVLAHAQPREIEPDRTLLRATIGAHALPRPCYARRIRRGLTPAVALVCPDPVLRGVLEDIINSAGAVASGGEVDVAARVELRGEALHVCDCLNALVHIAPVAPVPAENLCRCLRRLVLWRDVSRWLLADNSGQPLAHCYELRWSRATAVAEPPTPGPVRVRPGESLALSIHNLDRGAMDLYAHAFRVRADREIQPWSPGTGAQCCTTQQYIDAADLQAAGVRAYALDTPPALPPGDYREWTLVAVADKNFDVNLIATPLDARALASGFDPARGLTVRGEERPRRFDIVAFPYLLALGAGNN